MSCLNSGLAVGGTGGGSIGAGRYKAKMKAFGIELAHYEQCKQRSQRGVGGGKVLQLYKRLAYKKAKTYEILLV